MLSASALSGTAGAQCHLIKSRCPHVWGGATPALVPLLVCMLPFGGKLGDAFAC